MRTIPALAAALLLAGCGTAVAPAADTGPSTSTTTTSATSTTRPTLQQIVADPHARLNAVAVTPAASGPRVAAWWVLEWHGRSLGAVVTSDDGFRTARYERARWRQWAETHPTLKPPAVLPSALSGLLVDAVPTLRDGTRALVAGGDGATLFPFQKAARDDGAGAWQIWTEPEVSGQRGYTSGQAVLPDGRLLVLLDQWSDDRRGRANPVWHGLWVSDGGDWSSLAPYHPRFRPALPAAERPFTALESLSVALPPAQDTDGLLVATTLDSVYVSSDAGATFREIPARP